MFYVHLRERWRLAYLIALLISKKNHKQSFDLGSISTRVDSDNIGARLNKA